MSHRVHVHLGERSYDIHIVTGEVDGLGVFARSCRPKSRRAFIVCDEHVKVIGDVVATTLQKSDFETRVVHIPSGEPTKSLTHASALYDQLAAWPADRQTLVVAVGGGVTGDLAGFVAATYNRGLPLFMVPTTLLSMVDSSVGGKVGINHPRGKNLIGAFHQPVGVWIDTVMLEGLPDREYLSGLAEVVKYGVILDATFFDYLESHADALLYRKPEPLGQVISRSCRLKADVVEQDEREETGLRMALNYGHTFAHAFEAIGGYGSWLHGEAVSVGMICASRLAELRGLVSSEFTERQRRLLAGFGLPVLSREEWSIDELIASMYRDKKTQAGRLRFVLPTRMGEVKMFDDVDEQLVRHVLQELAA